MNRLGQINEVDPRSIWSREATEFTPWVRENINLLADALQMDLEILESEEAVGSFFVDLVGRDLATKQTVIIENQLEPTDHQHLGQLLTYAAGKNARIIVWISPKFKEEHIQTLNWLNESTGEEQSFFGVEIKVVKIDDSRPAPLFTLVAKPNTWQKTRGGATPQSSTRGELYRDFWTGFLEELKKKAPGVTRASKGLPQNWCSIGAGRVGFSYNTAFTYDRKFKVELYIDTFDKERNKNIYELLLQDKENIEQELEAELSWEKLESARASRIALYTDGSIEAGESELAELKSWGVEKIIKFHRVFTPRIKALGE
jgi:hypothetical protein